MKRAAATLIALLLVADQLTKWWVVARVLGCEPASLSRWLSEPPRCPAFGPMELAPFANIVMVLNRGVSFGLFSGEASAFAPLVLVALTLGITGFLAAWLARTTSALQAGALALIIGGAAGNLVDRLRIGAVIDFVDLHVAGYHWPAFNLADSAIVLGVGMILWRAMMSEEEKGR